ncbi:MAG: peptidylprolyl isomerase SurA [Candidatus Symbiodolus clandestinus]
MKCWKAGAIALLCLAPSMGCFAVPQLLDRTAIIVNKGVILESEINNFLQIIQRQARQRGQTLPEIATLRQQICEQLIMESLHQQLAVQLGLQVLDKELEEAIAEIATRHRLTPEQYQNQLAQEGLAWSSYRDQIRKELLIHKVRQHQVQQRVNILPQEIDSLAKQLAQKSQEATELLLSKILLALPEEATVLQIQQKKQLADQIVKQLQQGGNFNQLALTYSAEPQALMNNQKNWTRLEALPTLFAEQLQSARKGAVIGPIRTGVGFYILRVDDWRGKQQTKLEVHARHILLKLSPIKSDEQIQTELRKFTEQINKKQKTFSELARRYSQDPGSAAKGGDLGWADPTIYEPKFAEVLQQLPLNRVSQPIRTKFGWHLIERLGNRQAITSDTERREQAMRLLWERKMAEEVHNWLQEQRAAAYIKVLKPAS